MKVRTGFVSNSSSSSFLVAFKKVPKNAEELQQLMFGVDESIGYCDSTLSIKTAAEIVFHDMEDQKYPTVSDMMKEIQGGLVGHYGKSPNWSDDKAIEKWESKLIKIDIVTLREFLIANKGSRIFIFKYSDNDRGNNCVMEHGEVFRKLPHLHASHH